jgi:sulfur carrier protein
MNQEIAGNGEIVVNGKPVPLERSTLDELVEERAAARRRGIAVALNEAVVPREAWPTTRLKAGDRVEIIKVMVGG